MMIDGFLSRISKGRSLLGKLDSDEGTIRNLFNELKIERLDAIAVGHSHHDHALDAPFLSKRFGGVVLGNRSYRFIHLGKYPNFPRSRLKLFPKEGGTYPVGKFTITLIPSQHAPSKKLVHKFIEGEITSTVEPPAHFSKYNCGDVFAIHVKHPDGCLVVTTTAGAEPRALEGYSADVFFLAIGLLGKQGEPDRKAYFDNTVRAVRPRLVVPVHWDDFSIPFDEGLKPIPRVIDNVSLAIEDLEQRCRGKCDLGVLDFKETIYFPIPKK